MRAVLIFSALFSSVACNELPKSSAPAAVVCSVTPTTVDFGEVEATLEGASVRTRIRIRNHSGLDRDLELLPLGRPFSVLPVAGTFRLPAGSTRDFTVFFTPTDGMLHLDELRMVEEGDGACEVKVPLRGLGSGSLSLGGSSGPLDFGFMEPGATQTLGLNVFNSTREPVRLGAVSVVFDTGFSLPVPVTLQTPPSLVVPAAGTLGLELVAAPQLVGSIKGRVVIGTTQTVLEVPFSLVVGRPEPEVFPESFGPWLIGFDPNAQPRGFSDRVVRLRNVGNSGPSAEEGLRVTSVQVVALEGELGELVVNVPPQAFVGLASGEAAELVFHLEPSSAGRREFLVTISTNSPSAPQVVMPVQASAEELPFCELSVSPESQLLFTPIPDGRNAGTVTFTNVGTNRCVLDDVRLVGGAENSYAMVNGYVPQRELLPGEQHSVTILGPATDTVRRVGALWFHVFNPNSQSQLIDLYSTP